MLIHFEPLEVAHLPLLTAWLQQPHVRAFWDDGEREAAAVEAHYFDPERDVACFVFWLEDRPAGFIQRERVGFEHEFAAWARGETWGIDLLIGEATLLGRGYGPQVIQAFMTLTRQEHRTERFLIDPESNNLRAIRAYQKAGFSVLGKVADLTLMRRDEKTRTD